MRVSWIEIVDFMECREGNDFLAGLSLSFTSTKSVAVFEDQF